MTTTSAAPPAVSGRSSSPTSAVPADFTLDDRYLADEGRVYLTGIQALVRMLIDRAKLDARAGVRPASYVSGYEGSPLAGYDLEIARRRKLLDPHGVVHQPGLNEELAATAVAGTQLAGGTLSFRHPDVRGITGFWYGKAPGLDRAADAIRHANLAGTSPHGGAVALVGDDPSAKSSTFPCSSELSLADLQVPALYPADAQEVLEYARHAVELSRASGLWTALKVATNVADGASTAHVTPNWTAPDMTSLAGGRRAYAHQPHARMVGAALAGLEQSLYDTRLPVALEYVRRSGLNRIEGSASPGARIGVVASGKTWLDLRQALHVLGLDDTELDRRGIRLLKLAFVHPVEPTVVREFACGLEEIVVVEDKRAYLETAVKDALYGMTDAPAVVVGKTDHTGARLLPAAGELDPDLVATALARRLTPYDIPSVTAWTENRPRPRTSLTLLPRTPYFCSGCPHNSSTKVPDGMVVGGGIGCHGMVMGMPEKQVGEAVGMTQMGGEGAHWIGLSPFVDDPGYVQNLGDGTFAHSGSLAVRAAVAAGVTMTYKLLFNSTVAMTGGQDAVGGMPLDRVVRLLAVEGAARVVVTTQEPRRVRRILRGAGVLSLPEVSVRHRDELLDAQRELAAVPGVTVLVHDQECAAELRRKRKRGKAATPDRRVVINERVCEGCGDCGEKSNCMSVHPVDTPFGRKTQIHQSSCNLDFSCLKGDCPSFMTVVPGERKPGTTRTGAPADDLSEPEPRVSADEFAMRITGVGGTGVVTVAQVLATAGFLDGYTVRSLDQTGVAQKGGAVVSDVKFGTAPDLDRAAKIAAGECDLYLGCDILVAADPVHLKGARSDRTVAVVSTAEVPTGQMVVDTGTVFPDQSSVRAQFEGRFAAAHYLDAASAAEELLGDQQYANMLLVGAAYQAGALPVSASSLERAIRLNGAKVDENLRAFAHGRQLAAAQNTGVHQKTDDRDTPGLPGLLDRFLPELTAYQNAAYARSYREFVETVRAREEAVAPGSTVLTEAVAAGLFKLMAYKDEYEVARLILDPAAEADVTARFGPGSRVSYRLHPPVLRALGMKNKISLGAWSRPAFRGLYAMRGLRGTAWDPFGRAHVRRVERELVAEYRQTITGLLPGLTAGTLGTAAELAALPDMVRGYEDVKLAHVREYREAVREAALKLRD
ncbi:indolepyruvate ferredoxin oxidoreductase family protein [Streptomyces sp. DH41]|uniref:indolepyruvate ferredoxin oxidoreductase family protein n=1 Tax=Streptomyces sp. DH41 TaxID=3040125 RepID=UPI0024422301|nr:indolepyruvate ferredoxin oxidoreductase family protein [Streptomyces sp. DH41]MDG9722875.1 indolepyruvate ferredoxin oxidoreductase family protein [Streptomyces sp. DH41]